MVWIMWCVCFRFIVLCWCLIWLGVLLWLINVICGWLGFFVMSCLIVWFGCFWIWVNVVLVGWMICCLCCKVVRCMCWNWCICWNWVVVFGLMCVFLWFVMRLGVCVFVWFLFVLRMWVVWLICVMVLVVRCRLLMDLYLRLKYCLFSVGVLIIDLGCGFRLLLLCFWLCVWYGCGRCGIVCGLCFWMRCWDYVWWVCGCWNWWSGILVCWLWCLVEWCCYFVFGLVGYYLLFWVIGGLLLEFCLRCLICGYLLLVWCVGFGFVIWLVWVLVNVVLVFCWFVGFEIVLWWWYCWWICCVWRWFWFFFDW